MKKRGDRDYQEISKETYEFIKKDEELVKYSKIYALISLVLEIFIAISGIFILICLFGQKISPGAYSFLTTASLTNSGWLIFYVISFCLFFLVNEYIRTRFYISAIIYSNDKINNKKALFYNSLVKSKRYTFKFMIYLNYYTATPAIIENISIKESIKKYPRLYSRNSKNYSLAGLNISRVYLYAELIGLLIGLAVFFISLVFLEFFYALILSVSLFLVINAFIQSRYCFLSPVFEVLFYKEVKRLK